MKMSIYTQNHSFFTFDLATDGKESGKNKTTGFGRGSENNKVSFFLSRVSDIYVHGQKLKHVYFETKSVCRKIGHSGS